MGFHYSSAAIEVRYADAGGRAGAEDQEAEGDDLKQSGSGSRFPILEEERPLG